MTIAIGRENRCFCIISFIQIQVNITIDNGRICVINNKKTIPLQQKVTIDHIVMDTMLTVTTIHMNKVIIPSLILMALDPFWHDEG